VKPFRLALAGALAASVAGAARESEPEYSAASIARGRYLSPRGLRVFRMPLAAVRRRPRPPIESKLGAGDILNKKTRLVAPNITPDPETGAGRWTDDQLVRAIRQGISHDGRRLSVVMPFPTLSILTDDDVQAIVAYLRSLPPVRHVLPKWIPLRVAEPPQDPLGAPATPDQLATRKGRGGYLVHIARCVHCHSPRPATGPDNLRRRDMEFGGGRRVETKRYFASSTTTRWPPAEAARLDPPSFRTSPNITPDPSGIPYFDEAIFIRTIRTGRVAGSGRSPAPCSGSSSASSRTRTWARSSSSSLGPTGAPPREQHRSADVPPALRAPAWLGDLNSPEVSGQLDREGRRPPAEHKHREARHGDPEARIVQSEHKGERCEASCELAVWRCPLTASAMAGRK
jgi:mono/diheme cytochrome c family protein